MAEKYHRGSPVRVKSGQGPVPVFRAVDLTNQRLRSAESKRRRFGQKSVRQISTVDLRDQRLGILGQAPVRISLGQGIWSREIYGETKEGEKWLKWKWVLPFLLREGR
ncbi:hypothetical protein RHMOL_Rhmol03G0151100 [Rhododendron molle]|uniref:Uncharacterized protein n=1 Tax=Rhododendron molle TaxID=49168 RepID=A0ACC0PGV2_RHOML|nr:hypothetical protein RHMOL_Rhmol03G0151100 [Rhododendron molle]